MNEVPDGARLYLGKKNGIWTGGLRAPVDDTLDNDFDPETELMATLGEEHFVTAECDDLTALVQTLVRSWHARRAKAPLAVRSNFGPLR